VREATRGQIVAALLRARPSSRKQLASATGISPATVSRAVDGLIADRLVHEGSALVEERRGRRQVLLDIESGDHLALGIDVGGSRTRAVLVDLTAAPLASVDVATQVGASAEDLALWIAELAKSLAGARWGDVRAVALGLPGAVSHQGPSVSNAPNLPQVEDPTFLDACARAINKPLRIDNDANYALLGEMRFGAASGLASAAMVTLGAGLGVGLAVDGRLLQGRRGLVGEFGQLPAGPGGTRLEASVTGPGIARMATAAGIDVSEPAALFRADPPDELRNVRDRFDQALVLTLCAVSVASDPDVIVLGGGIAKSLAADLESYQNELTNALHVAPRLTSTALGDFAGAAGAAAGALHAVYVELGVDVDELNDLPAAGTLDAAAVAAVAQS